MRSQLKNGGTTSSICKYSFLIDNSVIFCTPYFFIFMPLKERWEENEPANTSGEDPKTYKTNSKCQKQFQHITCRARCFLLWFGVSQLKHQRGGGWPVRVLLDIGCLCPQRVVDRCGRILRLVYGCVLQFHWGLCGHLKGYVVSVSWSISKDNALITIR